MPKKVLIIEPLDTAVLKQMGASHPEWEIDYQPDFDLAQLSTKLAKKQYDALIVRNKQITAKVLENWRQSKPHDPLAVIRAGSNTSTIDVQAATQYKIAVMNTPGANADSVAEGIIDRAKSDSVGVLQQAAEDTRKHVRKDKQIYRHNLLQGKKIALIGFGAIGQKVAALAKAYGMNVVVCSGKNFTPKMAEQFGVTYAATIADAFKDADFASIQIPLNDKTKGCIGLNELQALKPGAKLINVSRRDVVNMKALASVAAKNGLNAALDLLQEEIDEMEKDDDLRALFNEEHTLTPLIACESPQAEIKITTDALNELFNFFNNQLPKCHIVNPNFIKRTPPSQLRSTSASRLSAIHASAVSSALPIPLEPLFSQENIEVLTVPVPGVGKIIITYEREATNEEYAYSGVRVLTPMSEEEGIINAIRLSLSSSSWKNWIINHAIKDGAITQLPESIKQLLPKSLQNCSQRAVYGGRVVIIPEDTTIETILKDPNHPEFDKVSAPVYQALGNELNKLEGRVWVTPDFGPNATTADIMHSHTPHVLGIKPEANGSGGKSPYSITSILTSLKYLGIEKAPKDSPITLIGSAGALGTGIFKYLQEQGFTNVAICDLQYDKGDCPKSLPAGWRILRSIPGKFSDECLSRSGQGSWIITAAFGDEMQQSNWNLMKPGTVWIGAQNKDLPEGVEGVRFAQTLKESDITHIPGQILTIGGTTASWLEYESRFHNHPFSEKAAHALTAAVTEKALSHTLDKGADYQRSSYEQMLDYAAKTHWQSHADRLRGELPDSSFKAKL